jgi:hypothetical protein
VRRSRKRNRHRQQCQDEQVSHVAGVACSRLSFRQPGRKPLSYSEHWRNIYAPRFGGERMFIIDASMVLALAAIITAISTLVW